MIHKHQRRTIVRFCSAGFTAASEAARLRFIPNHMSADDHANAMKIVESYNCPDPFAISKLEEIGVGMVLKRLNMPDRFIIIRDSVNMDVFIAGQTSESLWDPDYHEPLASENNVEAADIFAAARKNNFAVGSVIIQAVLDGTL